MQKNFVLYIVTKTTGKAGDKRKMRKRKMIRPREMTEQEKELIKKIKTQNIASYSLARNYTHISWYDKEGKELGCIFQCTGFIIDAVIEQWKKCKEIKEK